MTIVRATPTEPQTAWSGPPGELPDYISDELPDELARHRLLAWAASLVAAERERCAQYLRDAADRLTPEGKRTNQVDRHVANVLATKGDELAAGAHD